MQCDLAVVPQVTDPLANFDLATADASAIDVAVSLWPRRQENSQAARSNPVRHLL